MAGPLSGPGQGLQFPQALYPQSLYNGTIPVDGNEITLAAGQQIPIPRGRFWVNLGGYAVLQFADPVTQTWRSLSSSRQSPVLVDSDGFNFRVANLTGCAVAAQVTNGGSNYVQGSTTVTPSAGNSTWQPIVGGRVGSCSVTAAGAAYTIPPQVSIAPPPAPGVQATAIAVLSSGTVSSITMINVGAGYPTAPQVLIIPNPTDPAYLAGSITSNAVATANLTGSGTLSALLCTNPGSSFSTVPSLTIAGAGTSAAATIVPMWTITGTSITSGGAGYTTNTMITTVGGQPAGTSTYTNPETELTGYIPRPAAIGIAAAGGGTISTVGTIYDGGLFVGTPTAVVVGGAASTPATIGFTLGSTNASVILQKAD